LKPFEDKELQTAIEMALYKHKMERKLKENEQCSLQPSEHRRMQS
jgi:FixJ family two-component response regulator